MKKLLMILTIVIFFAFYFSVYAQIDTLTILHFNDTHSCLAPLAPRTENLDGTRGGIARTATLIGMTKMTDQNVLVLHAGDSFIGDIFFNKYYGAAELQLLNSIGVDAMAVGNHEFDLTPVVLDTALKMAFPSGGFPLLSANLILEDPSLQSLKNFIKPFIVKQIGNIKVGLFGMITPETNFFSQPSPAVIDTSQSGLIQSAMDAIDSLKANNCSVIICLSHLGSIVDQLLASYVPGINLIVGGHDHYLFSQPIEVTNPEGKTTFIVQAGAFYSNIGKLKLLVNNGVVSKIEYSLIDLYTNIPEEPSVKATVYSLISEIESIYGQVYTKQIGYATNDFEEVANIQSAASYDTPIGNLVTDAFRWKTNTDIAIEVGGSTAQKIFKGPIVAIDVFRMLGYGFNEVNGLGYRIVTFKITGADLWTGLESALSQVLSNDELLPQVSGMSYSLDLTKPTGQKVTAININNSSLDPAKTYSVTANEFFVLAITNPPFSIPVSEVYTYNDSTEFQVVTEFIASKGTIDPKDFNKGNISEVKQIKNIRPLDFFLEQNFPNPFNPMTNFEFRIVNPGFITLKIYDVLGNEVATIVNANLPAGSHKYQWNAIRFASGVYFYRLHAGDFVTTKKLILLK